MSDEYDYNAILGNPTAAGGDNPLDSIFGDGNVFDSVELDSLPDNPFELPANTYRWRIVGAEMKMSEKGNLGLILKYSVAEGSYVNRQAGEWLRIPFPKDGLDEAQRTQAFSNLNLHLRAFGLSDDQIKTFSHRNCNQLLGSEFWGTTVNVTRKDDPSRKDIRFTKLVSLTGRTDTDYDPFGNNSGPAF